MAPPTGRRLAMLGLALQLGLTLGLVADRTISTRETNTVTLLGSAGIVRGAIVEARADVREVPPDSPTFLILTTRQQELGFQGYLQDTRDNNVDIPKSIQNLCNLPTAYRFHLSELEVLGPKP
mmetsp:Transcript_3247/g.9432  ORF Transcript_3247/g.9432 Transcript_3247/m.9432 type:complete len:123 (-) Transcript_3247:80-448(-)